jgi:hypothetical protein
MSIWTDLLVLHGHVTTPAALALLAPASADLSERRAAPVGSAAGPVDRAAAPVAQVPVHAASQARLAGQPDRAAGSTGEPYCHPLRAVGQLP